MSSRDRLHLLIQSLEKGEKRYFKMWVDKQKGQNYIQLFDAIEKQKEYDEDEIKNRLKHTGIVENFAVIKNRLYKSLIDCMAFYSLEKSTYGQITYYITQIDYLLNKGDAGYAHVLYTKAEEIVKEKGLIELRPTLLLLLLRINRNMLASRHEFIKENKRIRDIAIAQSKSIARKFNLTFLLNSLINLHADIFMNNLVANKELLRDVEQLIKETTESDLNNNEKIKYNTILYYFFAIKKDKRKQLYYLTDTLNFLIKNRGSMPESAFNEVFYRSLINLYNTDDFKTYIAYMHKYKMIHTSMFYTERIQASFSLMRSYLKIGQIGLYKKEFFSLEAVLKKVTVSPKLELEFKFWICHGYFIMGEYKKSNKYLNYMLLSCSVALKERQDIHIMLKFIQLLSHYDQRKTTLFLKDFDELKKLTIDSDEYFSFCNHFFSTLKKLLLGDYYEAVQQNEFSKLKKETNLLIAKSPTVQNDLMRLFDITAWLKSKMQRKSIIELL